MSEMSQDLTVEEELEILAGVENDDKLLYLADVVDLAEGRWDESPPAKDSEPAAIKIRALADRFQHEPQLLFATVKKWRDLEMKRLGIKDVEKWKKEKAAGAC